MDVVVPCALEVGATEEALGSIDNGTSATDFFGCFTDCASTKIGVLTDNIFNIDKYKEKVGQFLREDLVDEFSEKCGSRLGTGSCNITGKVYYCMLETIVLKFV